MDKPKDGEIMMTFSKNQLIKLAKKNIIETYGELDAMETSQEKDNWHQKFGMMVFFIHSLFDNHPDIH